MMAYLVTLTYRNGIKRKTKLKRAFYSDYKVKPGDINPLNKDRKYVESGGGYVDAGFSDH